MSEKDSFYISVLIVGTMISVWIVIAICFDGRIPYFFCPLKHFFGIQCPFCKLTRTCAYLFEGKVEKAFQTSSLITVLPFMVIFPLSIYDVCMNKCFVYSLYTHIISSQKIRRILLFILMLIVLGNWILNNLRHE